MTKLDKTARPNQFIFEDLVDIPFEDVELSNTEREMLRPLAENGGPLARLMTGLGAYKRKLEDALAECNLFTQEGLDRARKIQGEIRAVQWTKDFWERQLSFLPEPKEEKSS